EVRFRAKAQDPRKKNSRGSQGRVSFSAHGLGSRFMAWTCFSTLFIGLFSSIRRCVFYFWAEVPKRHGFEISLKRTSCATRFEFQARYIKAICPNGFVLPMYT